MLWQVRKGYHLVVICILAYADFFENIKDDFVRNRCQAHADNEKAGFVNSGFKAAFLVNEYGNNAAAK